MCRQGRLYDIERWIAEGKPLQLSPEVPLKGMRPKTALAIAMESGQHSLASLLLRNNYRMELERHAPIDLAIRARRWDLLELLVESGANLESADVSTVLDSYNPDLYERFRTAGCDLTEGHEMAYVLGHGTSNRALLGFVKRHRLTDPKIQQELNIALGYHAKAGNEKGVSLCLWAGADPHAQTPYPDLDVPEEEDPEDQEEDLLGWSAVEEAARAGHLSILKRLRPDPDRDDFDSLYRYSRHEYIVAFLLAIQPPKDLTSILEWHVRWLGDRLGGLGGHGSGTIEALLGSGVVWSEPSAERLATVRRGLLQSRDHELKRILSLLRKPEVCALETYQELTRTPKMQERLIALGLAKKRISERERLREDIARLAPRYDRVVLYDQAWLQPVQHVARSYGISGVRLAEICRRLRVPVPPRGHWARVRNGARVKKPSLPRV
jgi:ankyrin repeat protein